MTGSCPLLTFEGEGGKASGGARKKKPHVEARRTFRPGQADSTWGRWYQGYPVALRPSAADVLPFLAASV